MNARVQNLMGAYGIIAVLIVVCIWIGNLYSHHQGAGLIDEGIQLMKKGDQASVRKAIGDFNDAKTYFSKNDKEKVNVGICNYNLGLAYDQLDQYTQAVDCYWDAINDLEKDSDEQDTIKTIKSNLLRIGAVCLKHAQEDVNAGKLTEARAEFKQAREPFMDGGDVDSALFCDFGVGTLEFHLGQEEADKKNWTNATGLFESAHYAFHTAGKKVEEADAYHQLALCYDSAGDRKSAAAARKEEKAIRSHI